MPGERREKSKQEQDREEIARLYLMRWTQSAIAKELSLSEATISRDLKQIQKRWQDAQVAHLDSRIQEELERNDTLEREYWEAWRRSQQLVTTVTTQREENPNGNVAKAGKKVVGRDGNPAFLAGVERCMDRRIELLGLRPPLKVAPTDPTGKKEYGQLTDDERAARTLALLDAARERRARNSAAINP